MVSGRISFIGAGPGAADLITLRGANRIAEADLVVWTASLVTPECVRDHARADAELVDSSRLTHEHALEIYRRAEREQLNVARVHSGDPALWGAVQEQYDACVRMDVEVEIVPGVAAFSAAAAAVGRELTVPEVAQSLVLTRLEGGKSPMPDREHVREFAQHGSTMALHLSAARTGQLADELRAGGYADDTPVLVAYKVSWPDELLLRTTVGEMERTVKEHKLWRHTLFLVGQGLSAGNTRAQAYPTASFHSARRGGDRSARRGPHVERGNARRAWNSAARATPTDNTERWNGTASGAAGDNATDPRAVDPDIAWWAVREWQADARSGNTRNGNGSNGARGTARSTRSVEQQPQLFGATATGEAVEETNGATPADAHTSATRSAADWTLAAEPQPATGGAAAETRGDSVTDVPAEPTSAERSPETGSAETGHTQAGSAETGSAETGHTQAGSATAENTGAVEAGNAGASNGGGPGDSTSSSSSATSTTSNSKTSARADKTTKSGRATGSAKQSRSGKSAKSSKSNGTSKGAKRPSSASAESHSTGRDNTA